MTQTESQAAPAPDEGKGKAFFDRADEVADTGNWDFAIELYIEGIKREPGQLERGHLPLRRVAMTRKSQGGKGPGMREQFKRRGGKEPIDALANAEYLLAKDPGSLAYMEQVMRAAEKLDVGDVVEWICDIMLESQRQAEEKKRNKRILGVLIDSYTNIEQYAKALQACEMALAANPNDAALPERMRELSAKYTIQKGKYDQEGSFTRSVKDLEKQEELVQRDAMVKSTEYLARDVERTRQEYLESPEVPGRIGAFVDALLRFEEESYENEAIDVLAKAHKDLGAYQFRMRIGDIKMRQLRRRWRKLAEADDEEAAAEQLKEILKFELEEFGERAANYPTDLSIKFDLGRRQLMAGRLDDAIASLQQAQRDPRRHIQALNYLGQAFARKDWHREAADTYTRALQGDVGEARAKELRYNLGDALEKMGEVEKAIEQFSSVAQIDYNYKDVRKRVENLRKRLDEDGGQ